LLFSRKVVSERFVQQAILCIVTLSSAIGADHHGDGIAEERTLGEDVDLLEAQCLHDLNIAFRRRRVQAQKPGNRKFEIGVKT